MSFSKSSSRAAAARRAVAAEIERIAFELRAGPMEDALAALLGGEVVPPKVLREALFTDGGPHVR